MIAAVDDHSVVRRPWIFALLLLAGTGLVYLPVWHAGLIWDDGTFVFNNPLISRADGVSQFWFSTKPVSYYPVTLSMLWLEWRLWGDSPLGYHLSNVLLHGLNALLLWRSLESLNVPGAKLAAALFAVHPVNVESVAWISEQKNTLALFFCLLSLLAQLRFEPVARALPGAHGARADVRAPVVASQWLWYWLSLGAFVLALLSKTVVAPVPLLLLGLAWWRRGRISRGDIAGSVPFFFASLVVGCVSHWFEVHRAIGNDLLPSESVFARLTSAGFAIWFYLYKALLPFDLRPIYPRWDSDPGQFGSWLPLFAAVTGTFACFRYRAKSGEGLLLAVGYFLVMLLPVLGFLEINFMRYALVADRWQYFAIIGPLTLGAAALLPDRRGTDEAQPWASAVGAIVLCLLGALSYRQCVIYTDPQVFWQAALAGNPDSVVAHNNLGSVLLARGQLDEAKAHFQIALTIDPNHALAHYNLGGVFRQQGRADEAQAEFQRAVELAPSHAEAQLNLAQLEAARGQLDDAISHFQTALALRPDVAEAHAGLGLLLLQKGQLAAALAHFERALELEPASAEAHGNIARALSQMGELDAAIMHLERAIELRPEQPEAYNNLANLLRQRGQLDEAAKRYQEAIEIRPDYALAHYNFGELLRQMGQPGPAVTQFRIALDLRPNLASARHALDQVVGNAPGPSQPSIP